MSIVEVVLGSLDEYPLLLTVEESAAVLRIGRSLAYELARLYESSDGPMACRCCESARSCGYPAGRWPS